MSGTVGSDVMQRFSRATREWFADAFAAPTQAQLGAWDAVSRGAHTLVVAPTGSGKTLAAFLWALDRLARLARQQPEDRTAAETTGVLYISPLKALGVDVERNLRAPLAGIGRTAARIGEPPPQLTVGVRSGDTPAAERRRLVARPPHVLITTPESLYLMLTSQAARTLAGVHTVIVDEIHALAGNKRGAHLALSLERLDAMLPAPAQRIGLSATVRPVEEVARFLGGGAHAEVVASPSEKRFDITVEVPAEDMTAPPMPEPAEGGDQGEHRIGSMWPAIERSLYERILSERSTIVFANSRQLAERLTGRLNAVHRERTGDAEAGPLARAHHGSVSKEQRAEVEESLKSGALRCVVATSSLELGIDMGLVDLVVQIDAPPSVASGLQRIGRAGHQVGGVSRAVLYPSHRASLLQTAAVAERMREGSLEALSIPANPLDVLAQQTVAAASAGPLEVEEWFETVRRAAPYRALPRGAFEGVLDLVSGKYPSSDFAELRPRLIWDREAGMLTARPGTQRLAVTSGGTIPDRGLFRVMAIGDEDHATRVGELDEEMVYESRVGDVFTLGATSWRIREITHEAVHVVPAFGAPGRMPFWRNDAAGRPAELGQALGELTTWLDEALRDGRDEEAADRLRRAGFTEYAVRNTLAYLRDQREATGAVPGDRTLVVERGKDEVGDWRLVLHSPYGMAVHAPWALAVNARVRDELGLEGAAVAGDDGIILRLPDMDGSPPGAEFFLTEAGDARRIVTAEVTRSALFAARFRECAARALLLGAARPGKRSPLWQQRQRSARLLEVASRHPDFPMVLEAVRECLRDVYDLDALTEVLQRIQRRRITVRDVGVELPSPFARSLLFRYVGEFIYEGDAPVGERKIAALSVDPELLRELLGEVELRELLDPDAINEVEAELQRTAPGRRLRGTEGAADLLRLLGPLTAAEAAGRLDDTDASARLEELTTTRRAFRLRLARQDAYAAIEDAGLLRDALGTALPPGVPAAMAAPVEDALRQVLARHATTHGPFTAEEAAARFGLGAGVVRAELQRMAADGRVLRGAFRPAGAGGQADEWVDRDVLRRLRNRSLARLRGSIEPVPPPAYAMFLASWQHCTAPLVGAEGLLAVIEQLAGYPLPASTLETMVLPQRVRDYTPAMLDGLIGSGEVVWLGEGGLPGNDGRISLHPAGALQLSRRSGPAEEPGTPLQEAILDILRRRGASFAPALAEALGEAGHRPGTEELTEALWSLVWAGRITSDSFAPVRAAIAGGRAAQKTRRQPPRGRTARRSAFAALRASASTTGLLASAEPRLAGRWSLTTGTGPAEDTEAVRRTARVALLLDRYGVVTRGAVAAEGFEGGFTQAYRLLSELERAGHCRRGYVVDGLGGAQFALPGTIDEIRELADRMDSAASPDPAVPAQPDPAAPQHVITLSATDPANPFGAALPWPQPEEESRRPRRNPGALVVIAGGAPVLYVERGGRRALSLASCPEETRQLAARSLVETVRDRGLARFTLEQIDGRRVAESPWSGVLREAGFEESPRGLVLRGRYG